MGTERNSVGLEGYGLQLVHKSPPNPLGLQAPRDTFPSKNSAQWPVPALKHTLELKHELSGICAIDHPVIESQAVELR